jgi:uncharacterized protein
MSVFVDTWGWLVLADRKDPRHREVVQFYTKRSEKTGVMFTSNFVLDETFTLLFSRRPFEEAWLFTDALIKSSAIVMQSVNEDRFRKALGLRRRFSDKPRISFTDLTSMVIMQELKLTDILTADAHFLQVGMGFRQVPTGEK